MLHRYSVYDMMLTVKHFNNLDTTFYFGRRGGTRTRKIFILSETRIPIPSLAHYLDNEAKNSILINTFISRSA